MSKYFLIECYNELNEEHNIVSREESSMQRIIAQWMKEDWKEDDQKYRMARGVVVVRKTRTNYNEIRRKIDKIINNFLCFYTLGEI